jgi:acetyl-CoA acetyltransferase
MRDVYILGVGQTKRGWFPQRSLGSLAAEAGFAATDDAQIEMDKVQQGWFGHYNPTASMQITSGQVVVEALGLSAKAGEMWSTAVRLEALLSTMPGLLWPQVLMIL